ncbi:unnamed protein product, partial [Didymodactylos carnosus]
MPHFNSKLNVIRFLPAAFYAINYLSNGTNMINYNSDNIQN